MSKEGNVLVIVIGGNISQILDHKESQEPKLIPASAEKIDEILIGKDGNSIIELFESSSSKGKPIRVRFEPLFDDTKTSDIENRDSAQVNPIIWSKLAETIKFNLPNYEGMVVLHGLDTLAYTASAISFMVRNLNIPIVFTGSQRPLNYTRSDARQNIYTAITIAASNSLGIPPINEVTIYLHDTLYRANRSTMSSASSYRSFDSLNYPAMATVGEHIDVQEHLINPATSANINYFPKSDANVQIIDVFPGMSASEIAGIVEKDLDRIYLENLREIAIKEAEEDAAVFNESEESKILEDLDKALKSQSQGERLCKLLPNNKQAKALDIIKALDSKIPKDVVKGVILRTYGMGTAPTSPEVLRALNKVVKSGIIVMNVTQAHSHRVSFNSDPVSLRLFEQGVISGLDMTSESAFAKMVVVLSDEKNLTKGLDHCEDELQNDIAGEQSHSIKNYHFLEGETCEDSNEYSAKLNFKTEKDFGLRNEEIAKIDNIQLRILGLRKKVKGGVKAQIELIKSDDESQNIKRGLVVLKTEESLENPKDDEYKTVNVSYDITHLKNQLFAKNAVFSIFSDQEIAWSRISIVIYSQ